MGYQRFTGLFNALTGMASRASNQIATLVLTLFATRYLNPAEFGVFALAAIAITLIRTILHVGVFEYLLKTPTPENSSTECLLINLLIASVSSALLMALAWGARIVSGPSDVTAIIIILAPSNLISAAGAWRESLLLRTRRLQLYYSLTMFVEIFSAGVAILLLMNGFGLKALVAQVYARNALLLILYSLTGPAIFSVAPSLSRFREIWKWALPRYASMSVGFGTNYGADVFLGIFLSPAATGLYRASSRLVTATSDMITQPIQLIAMTTFSARAAQGKDSNASWTAMFAVVAAIGWSALAGMASLAPELIPWVLGEKWRAAAALVPMLCLARACAMVDAITGAVLVAYNQQKSVFYVQCLGSAITIALVAAAAHFGVQATTAAVATGALLTSAGLARLAGRRLSGSWSQFVQLLLPALSFVVATACGARLIQAVTASMALPTAVAVGLAVAGGIAAWGVALICWRGLVRDLVGKLQGKEVASPSAP